MYSDKKQDRNKKQVMMEDDKHQPNFIFTATQPQNLFFVLNGILNN